MEAFDGRPLDRAVHSLDPLSGRRLLVIAESGAIGPQMVWLGQPMLNPIRLADHVEVHLA